MKTANPNQVCAQAKNSECSGTFKAIRPTLDEAREVMAELEKEEQLRPEVQFAIGGR